MKSSMIITVGLVLALLNMSLTMCLCGHYDFISLPGNITSVTLVWIGLSKRDKNQKKSSFLYSTIVTGFITVQLLKNIHNILWTGHNPLL